MADNVAITAGSGTTLASDDIGGVQYPRAKLSLGADGSAVDAVAGAGAVSTAVQRMTLASDDPAVTLLTTMDADTGGILTSIQIMDDWDETDRAKVNIIAGQAGITAGAGAVAANTPRMTLASDDPLLAAVTASIGYNASVSVTRTADTNAYTANDVLGSATGSTAGIEFTSMGPSGGRIVITSVSFERDTTGIISGETSYILHLYNVTPPSALGDNVAFDLPSGDRTSYLGSINLGTPVDLGSTLYIAQDGINKQIKLSGTSIFAYLVTVGGYTPTSGAVHVIKMNAVSL